MKSNPLSVEQFYAMQLIANTKGESIEIKYFGIMTYAEYLTLRYLLKKCKGRSAVCTDDHTHDVAWRGDAIIYESAKTGEVYDVEDTDVTSTYCREDKKHLVLTEVDFEVFEEELALM